MRTRFIFGISVLFLGAGIVVSAQQGNGSPKSTHATAPPKANAAKPTVAKPATPPAAPATAAAAKPHAASSKAAASSKPVAPLKPAPAATATKSQPKPGKPDATASKTTAKSPATTTAKTEKAPATKVAKAEKKPTTATGPATTTTQLTPVQQKLKQNTNLSAKLESRLPKGTNLMTAAEGFRNLGQFVAAVNAASNLNVSFDELKAKMVTNNMSLGQAIQAVRPLTASPTIEAQRAEYDARGMIAESEQAEASAAPKTHGPVTTPTTTPTSTTTSNTVKAKSKTAKTSAQ